LTKLRWPEPALQTSFQSWQEKKNPNLLDLTSSKMTKGERFRAQFGYDLKKYKKQYLFCF
jgi:hypothetical protein